MNALFKVKSIRMLSNISQVNLAKRIGMPVNTYIYKENRNKFYFHEIVQICKELDVDIRMIDPSVVEEEDGAS